MLEVLVSIGFAADVVASTVATVPIKAPFDAAWNGAAESVIVLMPQQVTYPRNAAATVGEVRMRALADPEWLAIRVQWKDATKNERIEVDSFTDGFALELPLGDPNATNPMMGDPDHPVYLVQWKAAWQVDVEEGRQDVQDYHPAYWADPYPFAQGGHPYPVEEAFEGTDARRYFVATSAGNPTARLSRRSPVEELHAEGFGSLAAHRWQDASAWGVYQDGGWTVVFGIPRSVQDPANPHLHAGKVLVGMAAWDGGAENVGGRKHWYPFQPVVLP